MKSKIIKVRTPNTAFHHLVALRENRTKRHQEKKFVVEGVRSINAAIAYRWRLKGLIYVSDVPLSSWARSILAANPGATRYEMSIDLMNQLSLRSEGSELLVIFQMQSDSLDRIRLGKDGTVLVFDRPANPGNLGSIIRTADAFGAKGVVATGHGVDVYSPEVVGAATGSFFAVPTIALESHEAIGTWVEQLRSSGGLVTLIATDEHGDTPVSEVSNRGASILLIGNETAGLSAAYKSMADNTVYVPMQGSASSLNAAVAASIILYEVTCRKKDR